tara:strand:+ start:395 stop:1630 length:1236 start_codon:yes stop_codon:yes gene_type:complete
MMQETIRSKNCIINHEDKSGVHILICIDGSVNAEEVELIHMLWERNENAPTEFQYSFSTLTKMCQENPNSRSLSTLLKKTYVLLNYPGFTCTSCHEKTPAQNRGEFKSRLMNNEKLICPSCVCKERIKKLEENRKNLDQFMKQKFQPSEYIKNLNSILSFSLLLSTEKPYYSDWPILSYNNHLNITGIESHDHRITQSLEEAQAIVVISQVPENIDYRYVDYSTGVYLNEISKSEKTQPEEIKLKIYERLISTPPTTEELEEFRKIIHDIQLKKLYDAIPYICKEYKIKIANTKQLSAILSHLSKNYPPEKAVVAMKWAAEKSIVRNHTYEINAFYKIHQFTKTLSNFINYIERSNNEILGNPPINSWLHTTSFEALFCEIFLYNRFDWNQLTPQDILAEWYQSIEIYYEQ